jgi:transposase-like protein
MSVDLSDPRFGNASKARKWFEAQRWPHGVTCPHCGNFDQLLIKLLRGKSHRPGLYNCIECRLHFTVTVDTAMHRSKIPLNKWLMAMHLMSASKVSVRELQDALGIAYLSAWSLSHRIRQVIGGQEIATNPIDGAEDPERGIKAITSRLLVRGRFKTILSTHEVETHQRRSA